jgi:predicted dinucleotide-binding enzyme
MAERATHATRTGWRRLRRAMPGLALLLVLVTVFGPTVVSGQPQVPTTAKAYRIGIIGSGQQGGSLGELWARAGHEVFFSSRHPEALKDLVARAGSRAQAGLPAEAAAFGEIIVIAVPYGALPQVGRDYAAAMRGKVVIEMGNPREDRDGPMANEAIRKGTGIASAEYLPGVRLVRTLNALSAVQVRSEAHRAGERLGVPVAADDAEAMRVGVQLVTDAGFEPVVVGGLVRAREFDRNTAVYVKGMTARQIRDTLKLPLQ